MSYTLIKALQNKTLYPHPVTQFRIMQTHLSWVLLTGPFAYKIKKNVSFGFNDFTTLEKRKYYCDLECTLNKRLAPQLYVDVLPITGTHHAPLFSAEGPPIEYAIKMKEFPQDNLLTVFAAQKKITPAIIYTLAEQLAAFHKNIAICDEKTKFGTPTAIYAPIQDNFITLSKGLTEPSLLTDLASLEDWAKKEYQSLYTLLNTRKKTGYIRACHGDLHLGNIVMQGGKPLIFDGIEFNESFRWIDVMNDISFLCMDLAHKKLPAFSTLLLTQYLEGTNDYQGALLFKFYASYRAMVRAKISLLQMQSCSLTLSEEDSLRQDLFAFLELGKIYAQKNICTLTLTFGVSGTGKTLYTNQLLMKTGAIRLRSDVIRKHLYPSDTLPSLTHKYAECATKLVYEKLTSLAHSFLQRGISVIIDATCLKKSQRAPFLTLAENLHVPLQILSFDAPIELLKARIQHRHLQGNDVSDATEATLFQQLAQKEPLTSQEKAFAIDIAAHSINDMIANPFKAQ